MVIKNEDEVRVIYTERIFQVHLCYSPVLFSPSTLRLKQIVYTIMKDFSVLTPTLLPSLNHWQVMCTVTTSHPLGSFGTEG